MPLVSSDSKIKAKVPVEFRANVNLTDPVPLMALEVVSVMVPRPSVPTLQAVVATGVMFTDSAPVLSELKSRTPAVMPPFPSAVKVPAIISGVLVVPGEPCARKVNWPHSVV